MSTPALITIAASSPNELELKLQGRTVMGMTLERRLPNGEKQFYAYVVPN